jgi:hypothetical protein
MAFFEKLPVFGEGGYKDRIVDINSVESFEFHTEQSVKVHMRSGDKILVMMTLDEFDDLCFKLVDEYGRLLVASLN